MNLDAAPLIDAVTQAADAAGRAADKSLEHMERKMEAPAPRRPEWQRWVLPIVGTLLTIVGVVFIWLPFTSLLLVIGLPMMFCFSRRYENAARAQLRRGLITMHRWIPKRLRRRRIKP